MKKIISFFIILSMMINGTVSNVFAMSPLQQALYQASIVELDVYSTFNILQKNNIDLNDPIEINGRQTTFLHELFQIATNFYNFRLADHHNTTNSQYDNQFSFSMPLIDSSSNLYQNPSYNDYKNELLSDSVYSVYQLFLLFLGFGADVDLNVYSEMSVRELTETFQIRQEDNIVVDLIMNCPSAEDPNYEQYKERARNYVISAIKCKKFSCIFLISILAIFSMLFFFIQK